MASNGVYMLANDPGDSYTDSPFTYTIYKVGDMTGVTYSFGWEFTCDGVTTKGTVASGLTSSTYTWAPTSVKFGPLMKKSQSGTLKIVVKSTDGANTTYIRSFTLTLKESVKPAVSSISIARTDPFNNRSVSNITTHKLSFNVAGLYGASQTVTVTIGDAKYAKEVAAVSGTSVTAVSFDIGSFDAGSSDTLAKSIAISVTDARGRTGTASTSVTIYKYTPPAITKATVERNADEKPVLTFTYSYQATVAGATNAVKQFWARCVVGSNTYQTDLKGKSSPQVLTGTYDLGKAYQFIIALQDSVRPSAVIARANLPSAIPVIDIGADGNTVTFFGTSPSSASEKSLRIGDMASFAGDKIAIGKNSTSSVIDFCNGTGTIGNVDPSDGYKRLAIKSENSVEIVGKDLVSMRTEMDNSETYFEMVSDNAPWDPNSIFGARCYIGVGDHGVSSSINLVKNNIDILTYNSDTKQHSGISMIGSTEIIQISGGEIRLIGSTTISGETVVNGSIYSNSHIEAVNYIYSQSNVMTGDNFLADNGKGLYCKDTSGNYRNVVHINNYNNTILGYGLYSQNVGQTRIYGRGIRFITKTPAVEWKPYYEPGDSITFTWDGAGFISASSRYVYFFIPLSMPIIGVSAVSVSSVDGLRIRQNNKYLYGSSASSSAKPSSYSASCDRSGVRITAIMANTTNVTYNNDACGINASIKITFS